MLRPDAALSRRCLLLCAVGALAACQDPAHPGTASAVTDLVIIDEAGVPPARQASDSVTIALAPVRVRDLALDVVAPIELEGAYSVANVVLGNSSARSLRSFYWFLDIRQGVNWLQAGWGWVDCGAGVGVVPPGRCALPGLPFTATHSGRHIGTLVPGPAVLSYELVQQRSEIARVVARVSIPVTLVAPVGMPVLVTPSQYTYFGAPPPGTTLPLGALVLPAGSPQQVTWTSSQPSVASVDANGIVSLTAPGSALIVATSVVDATKQGSSLISINTPPAQGNGVRVSPGTWNALRGMTTRLSAQVLSGPLAVTWSSNDPSVATVDAGGNVVATGPGVLSIRAASAVDASRFASVGGEILDYGWRLPSAPTAVSTGATIPAANPLSVPLEVEACGTPDVTWAPYTSAEWEILSGGNWLHVATATSVYAIDFFGGVRRCWRAPTTWTPGTSFGTGPQVLRAILRSPVGGGVTTTGNTFITLTDP